MFIFLDATLNINELNLLKHISEKLKKDLQMCSPKELQPILIEVFGTNKNSSLLRTLYNHLSIKSFKLGNEFLEPPFNRIKKKEGKDPF